MIPDQCIFLLSLYDDACGFPAIIWHIMSKLYLQLLLLNFEESGKKVGGLLVQKKTLILFDGSSLNSCCKNIRYGSLICIEACCFFGSNWLMASNMCSYDFLE